MIPDISIKDALSSLLNLVAPQECVVCGRQLSLRERHLCAVCMADLPRTYYSALPRNQLADRFNELIQRDLPEGCSEDYAFAASLFFYRSSTGYSRITQRIKYNADISIGRHFSSILGEEMSRSPLFKDVDLVVPVPLHPSRRWVRGHNQSETIARELAECLGASLRTDILKRVRRTKTQTKLSVEQKSLNVRTAFEVGRGVLPECSHILVVDDVFTTGATLHACFNALRKRFPSPIRISVATLASVGK